MLRRRTHLAVIVVSALALAGAIGSVGAAAAGGAGCHTQSISSDVGVAVEVLGFCYEPTVLRVEAGQTIAWTNRDAAPHTVSGANAAWGDFTQFGQDESISFSFPVNGVFPYFCALHPGMLGAVVVGDTDPTAVALADGNRDLAATGLAHSEVGGFANLAWLAPIVLASLAAGAFLGVVRRR